MINYKTFNPMRISIISILLLTLILSACAPTQEISRTWADREALPKEPFKSVFVMALVQEKNKAEMEKKLAKVLESRGFKVVKGSDVIHPDKADSGKINKEKLVKIIQDNGCEALYVLAVKDIKTVKVYGKQDAPSEVPTHQIYEPLVQYYPMAFGYYGIYYNYLSDYQEQSFSPDYYALDKTFFLETNLYNVSTEKLLWSVQSKAFNPEDLDSAFKTYKKLLIDNLKKEGLIIKK
jgi:hypothetical protein